MTEKIKVAVIGTGHLGSIHTKLWSQNEEAELVGIFDIDNARSSKLALEYNCNAFESLEETLDSVQAITVAVPTNLHYEVASKAIEKNVHCLIEKPITATNQEATGLINLAKEKNVLIQVGHVERFNPAISAIRNMELNPRFIEAHRLSQFKPRATDVSVIHDLMIHDIDIMLWTVKSKVSKIDANGVNVLTDTPDLANARITFENGAVANLTASRISANPMRKLRMFQKDTYISIDFGKPEVEVFRIIGEKEESPGKAIPATMLGMLDAGLRNKNIVYQKPEIPKINAIAEEQHAFVQSIRKNEPVAVGAGEAAEALRIAEEIAQIIK